ncbi:MAG: cytochrome b [Deltaproteobacteria bacterium]|nr:cytochrome b [Deltaproteobacteria bacterium]
MRWKSTRESYGTVSIALHWLMAAMITGLFFLGIYMTGLDYVHPWYKEAPHLHKSFGLMVFVLLVFRTLWALFNKKPAPVPMPAWESRSAAVVHWIFYPLLFGVTISGYLIAAADGRPIELFNWFDVPALVAGIDRQEDIAGSFHYYIAVFTICLAALHAMAALKHHFIDRDGTLLRMLGMLGMFGVYRKDIDQ